MANSKTLSCLGFIVGAIVTVVVGWMTFELIVAVLAGLRLDGAGTFGDPLVLHEAGELLVVGLTILGIYVWVFKGPGLAGFLRATRYAFWLGAALNAAAFLAMPAGLRWNRWALFLALLGALAPFALERLGAAQPPAES
jgi:hypothetical protein